MTERRRVTTGHSGVAIAFGLSVGAGLAAAGAVAAYQLFKGSRPDALSEQDWRDALDDALRVADWQDVLQRISESGLSPSLRREVWPFLLRVLDPSSSTEQRSALHKELSQSFANLLRRCQELETTLESSVVRTGAGVAVAGGANPGPSLPAHVVQFAEAQRIIVLDAVRTTLPGSPTGALTGPAGSQAAASSAPEARLNGNGSGYPPVAGGGGGPRGGVQRCFSRVGQEALASASHLSEGQKAQAARLINLLSAYAVHDAETGYCQGMSDLAAPFLALFEDDTLAFWCFTQLMQTARYNFRHDETGIRSQLRGLLSIIQAVDPVLYHRLHQIGAGEGLFAYRMLVVMLRREMPVTQTMMLWEVLWADGLLRELQQPNTKLTQQSSTAQMASQLMPHANGYVNGDLSRSKSDDSSTTGDSTGPSTGALGLQDQVTGEGDGLSNTEPTLLLFVVAAVVNAHRRAVLDDARGVDDVLRHFAGVKVEVWKSLRAARHLQRVYRSKAVDAAVSIRK